MLTTSLGRYRLNEFVGSYRLIRRSTIRTFAQQTTTVSSPSSSGRRPCRLTMTSGSSSTTWCQSAHTGTFGTCGRNPRAVRTFALHTACIPIHRLYIYTHNSAIILPFTLLVLLNSNHRGFCFSTSAYDDAAPRETAPDG